MRQSDRHRNELCGPLAIGSMVADLLTPRELTIWMIAAATAPAFIGAGLCYYFQVPRLISQSYLQRSGLSIWRRS